MPETADEIIAKCERCGFQFAKPYPSFDMTDYGDSCPECGGYLAGIQPCDAEDEEPSEAEVSYIQWDQLLRPGLQLEPSPRDFICDVLDKAFMQGLDSIDLRVTFTNRYEDEAKIEILAVG